MNPAVRKPILSRQAWAAAMLAIIVLASMPFVVALVVDARRIAAAREETVRLASALSQVDFLRASPERRVLVGAGNVPRAPSYPEWLRGPSGSLQSELGPGTSTVDPWRNAYLVNVGARGSNWVLSAGPNGIVDTPFEGASVPQADDIGARVGADP